MNAIGQSLSRADGHLKVTGRARYTADVRLDDALHASIVHSTIANGKVTAIDATEAEGGGEYAPDAEAQEWMFQTVWRELPPPNTVREPKRSATQPPIGMKTARVSIYAVMPMLTATAVTSNVLAMCGSAVAMTVVSRFSMKYALATINAMITG